MTGSFNSSYELISDKIVNNSAEINRISQMIEDKKVDYADICDIISWCSVSYFEEFCAEINSQIEISILGMNEMTMYVAADSSLRDFCVSHNIPEPDVLLEEGNEAKTDHEMVKTYFSFGLLGQEGEQIKREQDCYKKIREIIKKYISEMNSISDKANAYLCDTSEFNTYFEKSKLVQHKDILQKAIAVYDDKSVNNMDVIFTSEGVVPVMHKKVQSLIPYIALAGNNIKSKYTNLSNAAIGMGSAAILRPSVLPITGLGILGFIGKSAMVSADTVAFNTLTDKLRPMFDEICCVLMEEMNSEN